MLWENIVFDATALAKQQAKQLPGPQKYLSKTPQLWRCNTLNNGDDAVKATRWMKVNILSRAGSDAKQELSHSVVAVLYLKTATE